MRETTKRETQPRAWEWTHRATGKKELHFEPPADLPFNREHWNWRPLYTKDDAEKRLVKTA